MVTPEVSMNIRLHFVPVHVDIPYLIKTVTLILIQCIANPLYIAYVNITFIRGIAYKNTPANVIIHHACSTSLC